jgi:hypothetical protein
MFDSIPNTAGRRAGSSPSSGRLIALWLLLVLLLVPDTAQAYIDPGTGTMIWQMLVAGFLGALFYLRRLFPGRRSRNKQPTPPES